MARKKKAPPSEYTYIKLRIAPSISTSTARPSVIYPNPLSLRSLLERALHDVYGVVGGAINVEVLWLQEEEDEEREAGGKRGKEAVVCVASGYADRLLSSIAAASLSLVRHEDHSFRLEIVDVSSVLQHVLPAQQPSNGAQGGGGGGGTE